MRREDLSILAVIGRLALALVFVSKAQSAEVKTFTHDNDPVSVSACWERVTDEEVAKRAEGKAVAEPDSRTTEPLNVAWKMHLWSNGREGSNYCGWIWYGADTNLYTIKNWGEPVVYDARLISNRFVWAFYGNQFEYRCEAREPSLAGGEMKLITGTNWWRSLLRKPELPQPERALPQGEGDTVQSFTQEKDRITLTTCWEELPPKGTNWPPWWVEWKFHFWSSEPQETNYLGWLKLGVTTAQPGLQEYGRPRVYAALLVLPRTLLVVYGNELTILCEAHTPSRNGGGMWGVNNAIWSHEYRQYPRSWQFPRPGSPRIQRAYLQAESASNAVASLVFDAGMTNRLVWQPPAGWRKITPYLDPSNGRWIDDKPGGKR